MAFENSQHAPVHAVDQSKYGMVDQQYYQVSAGFCVIFFFSNYSRYLIFSLPCF